MLLSDNERSERIFSNAFFNANKCSDVGSRMSIVERPISVYDFSNIINDCFIFNFPLTFPGEISGLFT